MIARCGMPSWGDASARGRRLRLAAPVQLELASAGEGPGPEVVWASLPQRSREMVLALLARLIDSGAHQLACGLRWTLERTIDAPRRPAASVLHRALTRPSNERTREALGSPAERAAVARLIAVGLLEEKADVYCFAATPRTQLAAVPVEQSASRALR